MRRMSGRVLQSLVIYARQTVPLPAGFVPMGMPMQHKVHEERQGHKEESASDPTRQVIGLGIKIHRILGAGLLEEVYEECLCWELAQAGLSFTRQVALPLVYEGVRLPRAYRADIIIGDSVILEIKSVETITPVHEAQLLTCLRLSGCRIGLLMNFNTILLKDGLRRCIL